MKNRTVLGLLCIALAFVLLFLLVPQLNRASDDTVCAVRAITEIPRGSQITAQMLETVTVRKQDAQFSALTVAEAAVGKYAVCDIFVGDALTEEKVTDTANGVSEALAVLSVGEYAVAVPASDILDGFAGQLENGDIVRVFLTDREGTVTAPPELSYVRVLTAVNGNGFSKQETLPEEEPDARNTLSALMFAVNAEQAALLFSGAENGIHCAFVCHGGDLHAREYLSAQAAYFSDSSAILSEPILLSEGY